MHSCPCIGCKRTLNQLSCAARTNPRSTTPGSMAAGVQWCGEHTVEERGVREGVYGGMVGAMFAQCA